MKKSKLKNNTCKTIIFLILKREEQENFTSATHTNFLEDWGIRQESRQEPNYTRFCGINEKFRVYIKEKMSHKRVLRGGQYNLTLNFEGKLFEFHFWPSWKNRNWL